MFNPQYYNIDLHHNHFHFLHSLLIHYHQGILNIRQNQDFNIMDNWMDRQNIKNLLSKIQINIMYIKQKYKLNNQMYKQHIIYFLICNLKYKKYINHLCMQYNLQDNLYICQYQDNNHYYIFDMQYQLYILDKINYIRYIIMIVNNNQFCIQNIQYLNKNYNFLNF